MAKKIKDTDYLVISARVKAMETGLLTRERMEQILEANIKPQFLELNKKALKKGISLIGD